MKYNLVHKNRIYAKVNQLKKKFKYAIMFTKLLTMVAFFGYNMYYVCTSLFLFVHISRHILEDSGNRARQVFRKTYFYNITIGPSHQ